MFFFGRQSDPNRVFPECFVCIDFLVPQETAADTPAFSPHFPKKIGFSGGSVRNSGLRLRPEIIRIDFELKNGAGCLYG